MALSEATSNSPRPRPDWLEAMTACQPAWLSRAMASIAPGSGFHSSGDLMYSSLSALMVPSRSRMTSFMVRSCRQAGQVRNPVHRLVQRGQQTQAVQSQVGLLGIDHYLVEERIHGAAQPRQGLQRAGVVT